VSIAGKDWFSGKNLAPMAVGELIQKVGTALAAVQKKLGR
jgi:hypothetical protein